MAASQKFCAWRQVAKTPRSHGDRKTIVIPGSQKQEGESLGSRKSFQFTAAPARNRKLSISWRLNNEKERILGFHLTSSFSKTKKKINPCEVLVLSYVKTWRFVTFVKFGWNTFPNNARMNCRTDLNLELARLFIYQSCFKSQFLDLIYWIVTIFIFDGVTLQTSHFGHTA